MTVNFFAAIGAQPTLAYIGPGAGFALGGSALVLFFAVLTAFVTIVFWPALALRRLWLGRKIDRKKRKAARVVVIGLDGMDPGLASRWIDEGHLPHFKALAKQGGFMKLRTTCPPISPVAWSTFQTGVNPGAHNIFDFLGRSKRDYLPELSSARITPPRKSLNLGPWKMPLEKPRTELLRKSRPFWSILGDCGIPCAVLRVPITFTPEKFRGVLLSAMCAPDLKGTQGNYTFYTTGKLPAKTSSAGTWTAVKQNGGRIEAFLEGPGDPHRQKARTLRVPFRIRIFPGRDEALLEIQGTKTVLKRGGLSDWVRAEFKTSLGVSVRGICRFCLRSLEPDFGLYASAVHIDPEKPALAVSHPQLYSVYLAKKIGPFGTLGLIEDTHALDDGALDEDAFLQQAMTTHEERERMFFDALGQTSGGLCACVFDLTDRIQHMFWENGGSSRVLEAYRRADELVGRTLARLKPDDVLLVMSDHGFTSFDRAVHLNTWLQKEGYLTLENGRTAGGEFFSGVDWSKTRAYALGLGGLYLNRAGREGRGTVSDEEAGPLKAEIARRLESLTDPGNGTPAIRRVYDTAAVYRGAYREEAPDLIVGYAPGYRVSWESATGGFGAETIEPNRRAWRGDHCADPEAVPGVLFSNKRIPAKTAGMSDMAPTILGLFGVSKPAYMEGNDLYA